MRRTRSGATILAAAALAAGSALAPSAAVADPAGPATAGAAIADRALMDAAPAGSAAAVPIAADLSELDDPVSTTSGDVGAQGTTASIRTQRGAVYFYHWGDKLRVSDYLKDGYGVRGYLIANGKKYSVYTGAGKDTSHEKTINLPEGTPVYVQLCYTKKAADVKCSATVPGRA